MLHRNYCLKNSNMTLSITFDRLNIKMGANGCTQSIVYLIVALELPVINCVWLFDLHDAHNCPLKMSKWLEYTFAIYGISYHSYFLFWLRAFFFILCINQLSYHVFFNKFIDMDCFLSLFFFRYSWHSHTVKKKKKSILMILFRFMVVWR